MENDTIVKKQDDKYLKLAYKYAFGIFVYFLATAIIFSIIGSNLDKMFNSYPIGTIATSVIGYTLSLFIAVVYLTKKKIINNK